MKFEIKEEAPKGSNSKSLNEESSGVKIKPGIHQVTIKSIEVEEVQGNWSKGVVTFECIKTLVGTYGNCKGKTITYDIKIPKVDDPNFQENFNKFGQRLVHLFKYSQGNDKIIANETFFKELEFDTLEELVAKLKPFVGGSMNMKVVAGYPDRKYPAVPFFTWGVCEVLGDTTKLQYNADKEGFAPQNTAQVEKTAEASEELPF